ncbi:MAG: hypothetical protein ACW98U_03980 [Candidatus Thorarchaeota archaeon]
MDKKGVMIVGACIIAALTLVLVLILPTPNIVFHYEAANQGSSQKPINIHLTNFHGAFVDINFAQNESLVYDLDIEQRSANATFNTDFREDESSYLLTLNRFDQSGERWTNESVQIESLSLTLSQSRPHRIIIHSEGVLNTTVIYSSGTHVSNDSEFVYIANGTLNLTIEDGVVLDGGIFQVILSAEILELNVDLSNETDGRLVLSNLGFTHLFEWEGWLPNEEHPNVLQTTVDLPDSFIHISATSRFSRLRLRAG